MSSDVVTCCNLCSQMLYNVWKHYWRRSQGLAFYTKPASDQLWGFIFLSSSFLVYKLRLLAFFTFSLWCLLNSKPLQLQPLIYLWITDTSKRWVSWTQSYCTPRGQFTPLNMLPWSNWKVPRGRKEPAPDCCSAELSSHVSTTDLCNQHCLSCSVYPLDEWAGACKEPPHWLCCLLC